MKQKEGTYSHCSKCKINKNCCCDFDETIDNIIVTIKEKENITNRLGSASKKFLNLSMMKHTLF